MNKNFIFLIIFLVIITASLKIWLINVDRDKISPVNTAPSLTLVAQTNYTCQGDKTIDASFYIGPSTPVKAGEPPSPSGRAKIALSDGRKYDLPQTISADGVRYADNDESFIFWSKGSGALIFENGAEKDYINCQEIVKNGLKVIAPNGGESWTKNQKVTILWSADSTIKSVNIRLAISSDSEGQTFNAAIASDVPNTGRYEWAVQDLYAEVLGINALPVSDKYIVTIEDSQHNNIFDNSDASFNIK